MMPNTDGIEAANRVVAEILNAALWCHQPAVLVNSPPGAGKTATVEKVTAAALGHLGMRTMVAVQTNNQAFDLIIRLATSYPALEFWLCHRHGLTIPDRVLSLGNVRRTADAHGLPAGPVAVIGTADKWAELDDVHFELMVVDEAYQLRQALFIQFSGLADRFLFIGDPGQLDPWTSVEIERWRSDPAGPHLSCVAAFIARRGQPTTFSFPVSHRLTEQSVSLVQPAFYRTLPFEAVRLAGERELLLPIAGISPVDRAVNGLRNGVWSYLELPPAHTGMVDDEVASTVAAAVHALLERRGRVRDEDGERPLTPDNIAVGCARTVQTTAVASRLHGPAAGVIVETANRLQGLQFDITIVYHPLAGRTDATDFYLDSGRSCVLASRHRVGCLIVGRAGTAEMLERHGPTTERILGIDQHPEHDGWEAQSAFLEGLERLGTKVTT